MLCPLLWTWKFNFVSELSDAVVTNKCESSFNNIIDSINLPCFDNNLNNKSFRSDGNQYINLSIDGFQVNPGRKKNEDFKIIK